MMLESITPDRAIRARTGEAAMSGVNGTGRPVLITTAHRGVFFGYAEDTTGETIRLRRARLCVYWSEDTHGYMGLAARGPSANCRIGPAS
jgi:hypothetical protein